MRRLPQLILLIGAFVLGVAATLVLVHRSGPVSMPPSSDVAAPDKKALYWYDPMVPVQHFDHPGKSPFMDMQLVPKYAGGASEDAGGVHIDPRDVQNLGVRTARVERGSLALIVRATGSLVFDERTVSVVQSRVPGIVEQLLVRSPLATVAQGQPLLTLIAPDWTAAQEEYLALRRTHNEGLQAIRDAARQRLLLLGMSDAQVRAIERSGHAQTRITISAPRAGVVGELNVREGATVMAGASLLRINGLDTVWMNAAIPEMQVGRISAGAQVTATLPAFPSESFSGTIEALLPEVDAITRTQMARIVLANPARRLAPGMFAHVEIASSVGVAESLVVPTEAVIATGLRSVVIVDEGHGRFRAQEVRIGDESSGKTSVLEGLKDGDTVVLSGQFLIDSEASLTGTLSRLGGSTESNAPNGGRP
ncbi:efflux RND transporter periplasmic adaptor subunit [Pseudolysobacter antarcticus]|uniref:Efflux RND transporter periplasmic adaptor subunit n=1 Tax=Pseudolysobacter antarcticus TaxID=2511995 RepID=A0A411HG12_9GAMM|nr:efflux RND transporter periplasmic adaptor subunit [Pseudolysobacter antarcticus]QBB69435.1 efflux RND transporter periplasmic adaptor subunit [Pseudolysobacter antarcticus]